MATQFDNVRRDLLRRFGHRIDEDTINSALDTAIAESEPATVRTFLPTLVERAATERLERALVAADPEAHPRPEIVFASRHNAGRTQLAASITQHLAGDDVAVREIGISPTAGINQTVIEALEEKGLPTGHLAQIHLVPRTVHRADVVVLMGDDTDEIPDVPADRYVNWQVSDPEGRPLSEVREIRDELIGLIRGLLDDIGVGCPATSATA
ncbi:hypothetical protein CATYP_02160 [Corynebacterium atypicum]|uniref:Phosphotyrosine protein phosphatase I domain-containing protein n=1 Tax=Corynebacterium atypicum TaxID=191610 RepID=A0ABM5QLJ4_9CORY|nr:hypothetical protein CATYP_02160 [Corynebacterium atypicum]